MGSLFICHSVGDSNELMVAAEQLLKKTKDHKVVFLLIGNASKRQWDSLAENSLLKQSALVERLPQPLIDKNDWDDKELTTVKLILDSLIKTNQITNALIGTPSQNECNLSFHMAEYLSQSLTTSIYNGYLFYEADHRYWRALNKGNTWSENINWLVPLSTTKKLIQEKDPSMKVEVVGHPSIDNVLSNANFEVDDNQQILIKNKRQQLSVNDTQSLLFISGSKDLAKDKLLLEALFQALEKASNPKLELRLGIHPGIDNPNEYVSEILKSLEKFPRVNQQLKLLLKPTLASKIKQTEHKAYVITTEMSGDEVANLADSVASTPPATLVTMAALQGKPAYYHEKEKLAYIQTIASNSAECDQNERLFAGNKEISLFFKAIEKKTLPKPITLLALGLKQPFVEAVCEKFMKS